MSLKSIKITAATVYITDIPVRLMRRHGSGDVAGSVKNAILKLETDTGQQTRLFNFGNPPAPNSEPTWQGFSVAAWELPGAGGGRGGRGRGGAGAGGPVTRPGSSMRVATTRMRPGYFRRNGVPYGAGATLTEWFTTITEPDGNTYLVVTNILEDAQYMNAPYVRTVQFKKQTDTSGWNPIPCSAR